jgi:hypothetical protein
MQSEFKGTPVFCRNCSHSIDYHNPEMENLVMFFPKMSVQELSRSRRLLLLLGEQKRLKFGPRLYQTLKGPLSSLRQKLY